MNLELINNLVNNAKENKIVQEFIKELSSYLLNKGEEKKQLKENNLEDLREENCLYQVIDRGQKGVYLQNTRNNKIFEETELPEEIKDKIENDYILRYKGGKYVIEEELTDDYFNKMIGIEEYEQIQKDFIEKSNISEIEPNTRFKIISSEKDYTVLGYGENNQNQIEVPNSLLPYFMENDTILYYKDGRFEKE